MGQSAYNNNINNNNNIYYIMFNNCNPNTNGEHKFFMDIKNNITSIFDVGCRSDTEFINFTGEVHYFDPVNEFIEQLKTQKNLNKTSYFTPLDI